MSNNLVAYFSASGVTAKLAKRLATAANADVYEILPAEPYTTADLDWTNKKSRTTIEMNDKASRPALAGTCSTLDQYDTIFLGFPIWWYVAPHIINSFLESADFAGKTIIPFATSGGSGMGNTVSELKPSAPGATILPGAQLNGASDAKLADFVAQAQ